MNKVIQIANLKQGSKFNNPQGGRIYFQKGISPCIDTMGGGQSTEILMDKAKKKICLRPHKWGGARTREEMAQYPFMSMPTSDV